MTDEQQERTEKQTTEQTTERQTTETSEPATPAPAEGQQEGAGEQVRSGDKPGTFGSDR